MLSKPRMKGQKGFSKVAVIIAIIVIIIALIAGIIFFILTSNSNEEQNKNKDKSQLQENIVWDTNTEITIEEKNDLKNNYLGKFSLLISNKYQTEQENLFETAKQFIETNKPTSTTGNSSLSNLSDNTNTVDTNTISNTVSASGSIQQTMVNDTIVITGDNPLLQNTTNEVSTNTASIDNTAVPDMNIGSTTNGSTNNSNLDENEYAIAIKEIKGEEIENLGTELSKFKQLSSVVPGYVTDIVSITKTEGVYDITYKVCWPKKEDIVKYGTMDKVNTASIDRLDSTTVNIKLVKNRNYEYSQYQIKSIQEIKKETPIAYYLSYSNNKFGVIDQSGNIIIANIYDWVDIPNNYKDIFVCKTGTNTIVLNKSNEQIYTDYENISTLQSTAGGDTLWYEKDFLLYQEGGKYGAIDYDGFVIFEPIYDSIEPLYYIEGRVILTEGARKALADITGKVISNFKYTKIGLLGGQFDLNSMVNSQRTIEQVQDMVQKGLYIVGQDANGIVETIQNIKLEEYNVDFSALPQMIYAPTINSWTLMKTEDGHLVYVK